MATLTITHDDIKRLCGIATSDTSQDADIDTLLAAEQAVYEYALDPGVLLESSSDTGLAATLTLGVTEVLAGRFLLQAARAAGAGDDFRIGSLSVTASRTHDPATLGQALAAQGLARLQPYARAPQMLAATASGTSADGQIGAPLLLGTAPSASVFDTPLECLGAPEVTA